MNKTQLICFTLVMCIASISHAITLNEDCVVNILNRTIQVDESGGWSLPNVPANMGNIRARATCQTEDGKTITGQSDFFAVQANAVQRVSKIKFDQLVSAPISLTFFSGDSVLFTEINQTFSLIVGAKLPNNFIQMITADSGINYMSTNEDVVTVSPEGVLTATGNGLALVSARFDGVLASMEVSVITSGDQDGDGLPDDFETENGLNPTDSADAQEDQDGDGLSALEEYNAGTKINNADSDGDGISDKEELEAGDDGYITNPLLVDSDGDDINDNLEIFMGTDPTDENSGNFAAALSHITVVPSNISLTYNTIDGEASRQLSVKGHMLDGSEVDLTSTDRGTFYVSGDLSIASFGPNGGEVFAGQPGTTTVVVNSNGQTANVTVQVNQFDPVALSAIDIPGYANNVDVQGNHAFIAAGDAGLQVVDVLDRKNPSIVAALDTAGTAIDVKVRGKYAYVADGSNGLVVIDISNPESPVEISVTNTAGVSRDLILVGDLLYLANERGGLEIFNIADPLDIFSVSVTTVLGEVKGVAVENDFMAVISDATLTLFDVSQPENPLRLTSANVGNLKSVEMNDGFIYLAAYSTGWRTYRITNRSALELVGGDRRFVPRDLAVADGFTLWAEQLFANVVALVNIKNPDNPSFQETIDLSPLGDYAGTGIAIDNTHVFITEESFVVRKDYGSQGNTRLFVAQYRQIEDTAGVPPSVRMSVSAEGLVASGGPINVFSETPALIAGSAVTLSAAASDDVGVAKVEFYVDGLLVGEDNSYPYTIPYTVPRDKGLIQLYAVAYDFADNSAESTRLFEEIQPDQDEDGLGDQDERNLWLTDPALPDTDGDTLNDGDEVARGTDPNEVDSDGDGIRDNVEIQNGTDPTNPDITAPTIVTSVPANGSIDLPENASLFVTFDEPLQAKSIITDSVQLFENGILPIDGTLRLIEGDSVVMFRPTELLKEFTSYTLRISNIKDVAGNPLSEAWEITFDVDDIVDTAGPKLIGMRPDDSTLDVPVNATISVFFDEPLNPASVSANTFYISNSNFSNTDLRIGGIIDIIDGGRTLTFTPNTAFPVGIEHYVYLTRDIEDIFGNRLSYSQRRKFTTSFEADSISPRVLETTITDGQQSVPLNTHFKVRFDETVDVLSTKNVMLFLEDTEIPVNRSMSVNNRVLTLEPRMPLEANRAYQVNINLVSDLSGNILEQPSTIRFTTGDDSDSQQPQIEAHPIVDESNNVPLNVVFSWRLTEAIDPVSLSESNAYSLVDGTEDRDLKATLSISEDGRHISLIPETALSPGHRYHVRLAQIYDLAGNTLSYYSSRSREFVTGLSNDIQAPKILSNNLAADLESVPLNTILRIAMDEPINSVCVNASTVVLADDVSEIAGRIALSADRRVISFTPTEDLNANTAYTLTLAGLCDLSGQVASDYNLTFTTGTEADTAAPTVVSVDVQAGSSGVSVDTTVTVTFSEQIDVVDFEQQVNLGNVRIYATNGNIAGTWAINHDSAVFTPLSPLPGDTRIDVFIHNVPDRSDNDLRFYRNSFNTESTADTTPPQVVSISPNDGAMDVGPETPVVLTFSESINTGDVNRDNFLFHVDGEILSSGYNVTFSPDARTVSLYPRYSLSDGGEVVSVIVTSKVRDLSGNPIKDFISTYTSAVVDEDDERPRVVRQFPDNGASNVEALEKVVLYLDEVMDESTLADAFYVSENGILVDGNLVMSEGGRALVFTPTEPFEAGARVQVFLNSTATDDTGNPVYAYQGSIYLATGEGVGVSPRPIAYNPFSGQSNVPLNPIIQVAFNQTLNPATVNEDQAILRKTSDNSVVPVTLSVVDNNRTLQLVPDSLLDADSTYRLTIYTRIEDTDGERSSNTYSLLFNTSSDAIKDDQSPQVVGISPPEGTTDVPLNPRYHVRFDEPINALGLVNVSGIDVKIAGNRELIYTRYEPLASETDITEFVPAVVDVAGNPAQEASTRFSTSNEPDFIDPFVVEIHPARDDEIAPNNSLVRVRMSEAIDPLSTSGFELYDSTGDAVVPGTLTLTDSGRTLVWVGDESFLAGRHYSMTTFVTDLSGNFGRIDLSFDTGIDDDTQAPSILATSVFEGQADVPLNARIRVRFSEQMNRNDISAVTLSEAGAEIKVDYQWNSDRSLLTLVPKSLLPADSNLLLTVSGLKDMAGNLMLANHTVSFTTSTGVDVIDGEIETYSPADNTRDVPLNTVFEWRVSEAIDPTFLAIKGELYDDTASRFIPATLNVSENGQRITLTPDQALTAGHAYQAVLSNVYDLAGNQIYVRAFYVYAADNVDGQAPLVTAHNFTEGTSAVPLNASIRVALDGPLSSLCVNDDTVWLDDGFERVDGRVALNTERRIITFTPSQSLSPNSDYTLYLNGVCDLAGQVIDTYALEFTSGTEVDNTGPSVVSVDPGNGLNGVAVDTSVSFVFSELLDAGDFYEKVRRDQIRVYTASGNVAGNWDINLDSAVFTPLNPFPGNTRISLRLNDVKDQAGNDSGLYNYYFNTEDVADTQPPQLVSVTPNDGAMDIVPNGDIVLIFSESLDRGTINRSNFILFAGSELVASNYYDVYHSRDGRTVTLRNVRVPAGRVVSVIVTNGVKDLSGNALDDFVMTFTTSTTDSDDDRAKVVRQYPGNGATNADPGTDIILYTDKSLSESTVEDALRVLQDGVRVDGSLTISGNARALIFTPDVAFNDDAFIQVYLRSTATDSGGMAINSYQASFTVASDETVGVPPRPIAYNPILNQTDVPLNPIIQVAYNQSLNPATVSANQVVLRKASDNSVVSATISLIDNNRTLQVVPDTLLQLDSGYSLRLSTGIEDSDGERQQYNHSLYFGTATDSVEDNQSPRVLGMSPPEGATGVPLNPSYHLRFDEPINSLSFEVEKGMDIQFAAGGRELIYSRQQPLSADTDMTESVPAVVDIAGNPVQAASIQFRTGAQPDTSAPRFAQIFPKRNARQPPNNNSVRVQMSEVVDPLSINDFTVSNVTDGGDVPGTVSLESDGRTLVWVGDDALLPDRRYRIGVSSVKDLSGNSSGYHNLYFLSAAEEDFMPPTVLASTVFDSQTGVPRNARIRVSFSESMATWTASEVTLSENGEMLAVDYDWNSDHSLLTLRPKRLLPEDATITLSITESQDLAGNVLADQQSLSFVTGNFVYTQEGAIESQTPASNARDVPLDTVIEWRVSEMIDLAQLVADEDACYLYDNTARTSIECSLITDETRRIITLIPSQPLVANNVYQVGIRDLRDLAGFPIYVQYNYFYTVTE